MTKRIEFFFDVGSPTAYLAHGQLKKLAKQYNAELVHEPVLLGAIHQATNNMSPAMVPVKGKYMAQHDLPRFIKRYGCEFNMNPHFPINTLGMMRGCYAAKAMGCFDRYIDAVFNGMWVNGLNMGDPEVFAAVMEQVNINAQQLLDLMQQDTIKNQLKANTQRAIDKELFGVPTMFIGEQMFFGQDRFDFVEEALAS
jgi:2-hydroxychromene-2-carboxylate isomerase